MSSPDGNLFVSSDDDDVSANYTPASSPRSTYAVETILAERTGADGGKEFLVKWEEYQIHRATWEPRGNISSPTLRDWEEKKPTIKEPFDTDWFNNLLAERHRRRREKRIARGLSLTPTLTETEAFDGDPEPKEKPSGSVQQLLPKRTKSRKKGTAQLKKAKRQLSGSSPISISSEDELQTPPSTSYKRRIVISSDSEAEPQIHLQDSLFQETQSPDQQLCQAPDVDQCTPSNQQPKRSQTSPATLQNSALHESNVLGPEKTPKLRNATIHVPQRSISFGLFSGTSSQRRPFSSNKDSSKAAVDDSVKATKRALNNTSKIYTCTFKTFFCNDVSVALSVEFPYRSGPLVPFGHREG